MPRSDERFEAAARALGLDLRLRRFPQGTRTAEDAARAIGCEVGQIVKSLVFVGDGSPFLALTSGANQADQERLRVLLGVNEVRRASAEEARSATGYAIGGTPPFGHPAPLPILIDRDLLAHDEVWAAGGTPDTVFAITPAELVRACGGEPATFAQEGTPG